MGNGVPASKEEFPQTCMNGNVPPAGVELVVSSPFSCYANDTYTNYD